MNFQNDPDIIVFTVYFNGFMRGVYYAAPSFHMQDGDRRHLSAQFSIDQPEIAKTLLEKFGSFDTVYSILGLPPVFGGTNGQ